MKIIVGKMFSKTGSIELGANVKAAYYDQENQNLDENSTVLEELWNAYPTLTEYEIRSALALFLFKYDDTEKRVRDLSGGERARLTFAKLILSKVNLLILDEPTNHLDIPSREALENALSAYDGTVVCVSHDRFFIEKLATRIIEILPLHSKPSTFEFKPTTEESIYEAYREKREAYINQNCNTEQKVTVLSNSKDDFLQKKKEAAEKRKNEKQIAEYIKEMEELEAELVKVTDELYGDAASDYMRAAELDERKAIIEDRLLQLYEILE